MLKWLFSKVRKLSVHQAVSSQHVPLTCEPTNIITVVEMSYFVACRCIDHYKNDPVQLQSTCKLAIFNYINIKCARHGTAWKLIKYTTRAPKALKQTCWAEALLKIARMTLTIKLDGNWSSFQLANSAPPLSVTDSALAPSARIPGLSPFEVPSLQKIWAGTASNQVEVAPHSKNAGKTATKFAYHWCNSYILYCCSLRWMQRQIFKQFSCFYPIFILSRDCNKL